MKRGEEAFEHRGVVASITEQIILGLDYLKEQGVKLELEAGVMHIKDQRFLLLNRTYTQVRKDVEVAFVPMEEVVVPQYVDGIDSDLNMDKDANHPDLANEVKTASIGLSVNSDDDREERTQVRFRRERKKKRLCRMMKRNSSRVGPTQKTLKTGTVGNSSHDEIRRESNPFKQFDIVFVGSNTQYSSTH